MSKVKSLVFTVCAVSWFLSGCGEVQRPEGVGQICPAGISRLQAMRTAEEVLGHMHFTIDKADAEAGVIKTRPLAGAKFFELWRSDNVGAFNFAEANLHSIRRIVELKINEQDGQLCIGCDVNVQRLSMPEQEVSIGRAYELFSKSTASIQKLKLQRQQKEGMRWIDLGSDKQLSEEILRRIEKGMAESGKAE